MSSNGRVINHAGGAAYIRPLKSVFEVAEFVHDPIKKFSYKLSPMLAAVGRQLFPSRYQKDYKGMGDIPKRTIDFIKDVGTPITAQQWIDVYRGKKTPIAGALPFFGFPTSTVRDKGAGAGRQRRTRRARVKRKR